MSAPVPYLLDQGEPTPPGIKSPQIMLPPGLVTRRTVSGAEGKSRCVSLITALVYLRVLADARSICDSEVKVLWISWVRRDNLDGLVRRW